MIRKFKGICGGQTSSNKKFDGWVYGEGVFTRGINNVYLNHKLAMIEVIEDTVCQYIGVEDSDGNEIYENDIVEYAIPQRSEIGDIITRTYNRGVVFFNYETLAFYLLVTQNGKTFICSFADLLKGGFTLKVIGNKFDELTRCSEKPNN